MIEAIEIPSSIDQEPLPAEIRSQLSVARQRIEAFQDRWDRPQIEQFVAADYELVYQALVWALKTQPTIGRRFLEWGCGFAVVSAIASHLNLDATGIESESELLSEGRLTIVQWQVPVELVHGNFLPPGSESLSYDPTLPSLGHNVADGYEIIDSELDDFAIVYSYPWPGEDEFHLDVFHHYAAKGALLMQFCGPNDVRLWRKTS
ncbi:MAG: class I SAM-dependent methyltransferase [Pirellulaceae bacterium]